MTHKSDGFIENLMKVPAPLKVVKKVFKKVFNSKNEKEWGPWLS